MLLLTCVAGAEMGGSRREKTAEHDLEGNGEERRCACSSPPYSSPQSPRDRTPFLILHSLVYFMLLISLVIFFLDIRRPIRCRSSVFTTSMGLYQFDSIQHHW